MTDFFFPAVSAASGPKRVTAYTYMYGFGGYLDDLTEVRGFDDFQWDGEYVWAIARYDYCSAESHSTGWWNGYCFYRELVSSSNTAIATTVEGSFWWDPPPQGGTKYYQHSLFNRKVAKPNGSAYCGGWFTGSIVYGWHVACRVQQPPPCGVGVICFETDPW